MPITFKSKAGGDVIMLNENAREMLTLLGKNAEDSRGIFITDQLPPAIAALKQAITADKALHDPPQVGKPINTHANASDGVRLYQRGLPLLELMECALQEDAYVTWGV